MIAQFGKRSIAFLLAVLMLISVVPAPAYATEGEHDHEHECLHEYTSVVTDPGCETGGYTTYTCSLCGDSYTADEVAALGHSDEAGTPVAATPEAQGYTPYTCALCGRVENRDFVDYVVPQASEPEETQHVHNFVAGTPVAATPEAQGYTPYTCDGCGSIENRDFVNYVAPETQEPEVNPAVAEIQADIDDMLTWYLGGTQKTREEIEAIVTENLTVDDIWMARVEIYDLEAAMAELLTEEEIVALIEKNTVLCDFAQILDTNTQSGNTLANTLSVLDGKVTITDSLGNGALASGVVTVKAQSSMTSPKTNTITVTNVSGMKAKITFAFAASSYGSFSMSSEKSPYAVTLDNGGTHTITLKGMQLPFVGDASLTLSGFVYEPYEGSANVTLNYDSSLGTVSTKEGTFAAGTTGSVSAATGMTAKANSGASFVAWMNTADNTLVSTNATYVPEEDTTPSLTAVFAKNGGTPWFLLGTAKSDKYKDGWLGTTADYHTISGTQLFEGLNAAAEAAAAGSNKYMVLMNNATLPSGEHTIPSGVTMLIPFDSTNTLYTTAAISTGTYTTPTAYRTLSMADGAKLTVNGALSLSAKQMYVSGDGAKTPYGGAPTGSVSFIKMQGSSNITVNSGGVLYAYGFITGSGSITANSGSSVYEMFQITDFRGGTQSTDMENGVFPISQYYIQNIEVPLTIHTGATEYAYTTVYMSSAAFGTAVAFISNSGSPMFKMSSGSVMKKYDGSTDRLMVEADGNLAMSPIKMSVGTKSLDSSEFVLGINGNITVEIKSGSDLNINQDLALLPGSKIIVNEGASCTMSNAKSLYIYDADQWGTYTSHLCQKFVPIPYAPGKNYTRTEADLVDAAVEVNGTVNAITGYVYTTEGGANIYSTGTGIANIIAGSQTKTYQYIQTPSTYVEIPITPAKLKNADDTYTSSNIVAGVAYTFKYDNGTWRQLCDGTNHVLGADAESKEATCTEAGYKKGYCVDHPETYVELTIPALGHDEQSHDAQAPTCTAIGWDAYVTCSCCDYTTYVEKAALGHSMNTTGTETTKPTCTTEGVMTYTCSRSGCDYSETETIPALGHTETTNTKVFAPTCEEAGYTEHTCTRCYAVVKTTDQKAALGHAWTVSYSAKIEDVSAEGKQLTAYRSCGNDATHNVSETVNVKVETTVEATCKVQGETTYTADFTSDWAKDQVNVDQTGINADNHKNVTILQAVAPTCETDGLTEGKHCNDCNTNFVAQEVDPKLGHDWTVEYEWFNNFYSYTAKATCVRGCTDEVTRSASSREVTKEATCTVKEEGTYYFKFSDAREWEEEVSHAYVGSTNSNHTGLVTIPAKDPTCTEPGYLAGEYCEACETYTKEVVESGERAYGHAPGTAVKEKEVAATCETAGSYDSVVYCMTKDCGAEVSRTSVTVDALGHKPGETVVENNVAPTCTAAGSYDNVTYCTVCNAETSRTSVAVDALGHKSGETVVENNVDPTCTAAGSYDNVTYCTVCKAETSRTSVAVEALGHKPGTAVKEKEVAATCTATGSYDNVTYCTVCKAETSRTPVTVDALGHKSGEIVVENNVNPTCTATGSYDNVTYCTVCNAETSRTSVAVDALGHEEVSHNAKAPTCTEIGWDAYVTCSNCDYTTYVEKSALGHDIVIDAAVAPTCTATGLTEGSHCSRCEDMTVAQEKVKALGHNYEGAETTAPTCTTAGVKTFTCTRGDHSYTEAIDALGHDEVSHPGQIPSCTQIGWGPYETCSRCDYISEYEKYDMQPHSEVTDKAVAPTCTATGLTEGKHCSVCDEVTVAQETVDALGHKPGEIVVENNVAPTCTKTGSYDNVVYCTVCEEEQSRETITVPVLPHTEETIPAKDPTCEDTGLTAGVKCSVCGEILTAQEEVKALGHKNGEAAKENVKDSTCKSEGSYDSVIYCTVCKEEQSRETIIVPVLPHTEETIPAKDPTCEGTGLTAGVKCSVCGEVTVAQETVAALGHKNGEAAKENVKDSTCKSEGSYDSVIYCTVCKEEQSREIIIVPVLPHTEETIPAKDPTCEDTGLTAGVKCSVCGEILTAQEEVKALGHSYDNGVESKAPTCTDAGIKTFTCQNDGCGDSYTEEIPATNHKGTTEIIPGKAVTCTEDGWTESSYCNACKTELVKREEIKAEGHKYVDGECACGDVEGVTVSGTVTSFNSDTDTVTIELYAAGEETAVYSTTVTGNSASYSIDKVKAGTYTMKVSKKNHVTREYAVTVEKEAVTQDVMICLIGDINGDGNVNAKDNGVLMRHIKETQLLSGYAFAVADINGDELVNAKDDGIMMRHIKETQKLW